MALAAIVATGGCGAGVADDETISGEEFVSEGDALTAAEKALVGTWSGTSGAYRKLAFTSTKRYTGEQIVYCVRAPCPPVKVSGTWSLPSSGKLTLAQSSPGRSTFRYAYSISGGTKLTIKDPAAHGLIVARLTKATGNACVAAGGVCAPLVANPCGSGYHPGDARSYPCGPSGVLGVACCLPN